MREAEAALQRTEEAEKRAGRAAELLGVEVSGGGAEGRGESSGGAGGPRPMEGVSGAGGSDIGGAGGGEDGEECRSAVAAVSREAAEEALVLLDEVLQTCTHAEQFVAMKAMALLLVGVCTCPSAACSRHC